MFLNVTVVEQATEKTHDASPRRCKDSYARSYNSDNALKNDASGAWIEIGRSVRHACNGEIAQQKDQQSVFSSSIHRATDYQGRDASRQ